MSDPGQDLSGATLVARSLKEQGVEYMLSLIHI